MIINILSNFLLEDIRYANPLILVPYFFERTVSHSKWLLFLNNFHIVLSFENDNNCNLHIKTVYNVYEFHA
jgi:hypothetical protein